jgi:hypothetical protein
LPTAIAHVETRAKVEVALEKALVQSTFCRDWRNRYIAHRDLDLALSRSASPLELASREKVNKALESLTEVLNPVALHYLETTTFFESPWSTGGAENLLYVINDGLKAREARKERRRTGTALPRDWKLEDL